MPLHVLDEYSESNRDNDYSSFTGIPFCHLAQSFTASTSSLLDSCQFFLFKGGLPTGVITAHLYTHTGTFGTTGEPGVLLATSETIDISGLSATIQSMITFNFTGVNRVPLTAGANYFIEVCYDSGDGINYLGVGFNGGSPAHLGASAGSVDTTVWIVAGSDLCFRVFGRTSGGLTYYIPSKPNKDKLKKKIKRSMK